MRIRNIVGRIVAAILWLVILLCLTITIVPAFLDRIYYRGPPSGHFDGARFFNPDGEDTQAPPAGRTRTGFLMRQLLGNDGRPAWPAQVAVRRTRPAPRVTGDAMVATWIGHATVLVQTQGLNILTDPVWSDRVGPFGAGPKRVAAPGVRFEDLPKIDLVLVSHDHYDHLDLATLKRRWARDRPLIVTSLGNDSVIGQAGVPARALDWGQALAVKPGVSVVVTRSHHWSSRWFADRNRALWSSFVVRLPGGNIFFAGDTGPGDLRWASDARALGPVRLALLPIGAFRFTEGQMVSGSHIGPLDAVRAWDRLGRPRTIPVHWGTFRLSWEGYHTPPAMLAALLECTGEPESLFAPVPFGQAETIAPVAPETPPVEEARLAACARNPRVTSLR